MVLISKKIFTIIVCLLILFSCNTNQETNNKSAQNIILIKKYFEHFNKHDWKIMAEMYAPNAEFKDPSFGKNAVPQTRAQTMKKYQDLQSVFPNLKDEIVNLYSAGNEHVIVEFVSKGTAPDKSTFELPICTIFTIENNLITKDYTYYDNFEEK